jgi:membrane protease YdiL (CAAX protease family)
MTESAHTYIPHWKHLIYLVLIAFGCAIIGLAVSLGVIALIYGKGMALAVATMNNNGAPGFMAAFRIFLGLGNTLFTFFVAALIYGYYVVGNPDGYLRMRNYCPPILLVMAVVVMIFFLPVIDITSYFNQKMTLLPAFPGLDKWIHDGEKQNEAVVKMVLNMKSTSDLLISVFIVGFLPALSEEFFFRGCMQSTFMRWTRNTHAAVWITAFIFSFIHFEFLGFVPRFLLGAALGYFFAWSGSIWPSVVLHFLNNSFSVVGYYLYQHKLVKMDPDSNTPMFSQMWVYVICFFITILLMLLFRKITIDKQLLTDGEELD